MTAYPWPAFAEGLAYSAVAALTVMLLTFLVAVVKGVHRIVDVAWGLGFTAIALVTFAASDGHGDGVRRLLATVLTAVWGLRLAVHIGVRRCGHGEDARYERLLARAPGNRHLYALRVVYLLQAGLIWLVSLPIQAAQYASGPPGPWSVLGMALWLLGLTFEAVGDSQLARFRADPRNRGRIMDQGLWRWTRHPNYFGDFCVWWGLFLLASETWQSALVSVISPLAMTYVLIQGSGKALLERHMADRPGFAAYASRTSGFFPRRPAD
ncbi:DUF1295 domain-containing protein [Streptomyces sp. NPDC021212]|uniref:DUF1295 domain-containing protein n=1 Tax=Streptomyces sp. NPDC021212 TaxID=3365118 RepID=UPI0037BABD3D